MRYYITICADNFNAAFQASDLRNVEGTDTIIIGGLDQRLEIKNMSEWHISKDEDEYGVHDMMVSPDGKITIEILD